MNCKEIRFGTADCAYKIQLPWKCKFPWEKESQRKLKNVFVDKCLLDEVKALWEQGIKTTGCCCGHGNQTKAFISVQKDFNQKMVNIGYKPNNEMPESHYTPKTELRYGEIQKGFNWWDNG